MPISRLRLAAFAAATLPALATAARADTTLRIATVNNSQMIEMQKLTPAFEKSHPGIHLAWVVLEENVLRQRVTTDIATHGGQFDVLTIGNYEVPIWAKQGWLASFDDLPASYDVNDLVDQVRQSVSQGGKIYALPFYAESVMTYYRTDLFKAAGLTMPAQPSYDQVRGFADKLTDAAKNQYGICLRGKPGWGENMAYVTSLVTAFGGQWFDMAWKPTIDTKPWHAALTWYDETLAKDGPPGESSNGFNENLALFAGGHCAMWIDATSAAGTLFDPKQSQVPDKVGVALVPSGAFKGGPTWLWSWNLAVPVTSTNRAAAQSFVAWATSKEYIKLVAATDGWVVVPPGTRKSTYASADYQKVATFAPTVLKALEISNPNGQTAEPRPYHGAQFVGIPQFQSIGTQVGQIVASTLTGGTNVDNALKSAQAATQRTMRQSGYYH